MREEIAKPVENIETVTTEFVTVRRKKKDAAPIDLTIQVVDIRQIARGNYVVARVSLACGYSIGGCLLAHQSIEMYLKGIILAYGGSAGGHNLRELVGVGSRMGIEDLTAMSQNSDQMALLKQLCAVYDTLRFELCAVYDTLRFGEQAGYVIDNKNIVLFLDEVAYNFEKMYSEKLSESNPLHIYVHETLKDRFLKLNDYFKPEMVTNNSKASNTTNEKDMPEIPPEQARRLFTVTSIQARGLTGNIAFVHVPKRVAKEERERATHPSETEEATDKSLIYQNAPVMGSGSGSARATVVPYARTERWRCPECGTVIEPNASHHHEATTKGGTAS